MNISISSTEHCSLNIIVTGAAGLLGSRLIAVLAKQNRVTAVVHKSEFPDDPPEGIETVKCDLTDPDAVRTLIPSASADVIVNSAATTDVDGCEDAVSLASNLNCGIVANLLDTIDSEKTRFVQISTDYIFDGESGPYPESASPHPLNVYGRTKLDGELEVNKWNGKSLIIRTSALFDSVGPGKTNLFTSAYDRLSRGEIVKVASDIFCSPMWTVNLSQAIAEAIELDVTGIMNIAGREYMSREEFALQLANAFGLDADLVRALPIDLLNRPARRPYRAGLDVTKASRLLRTKFLSPSEVFSSSDFIDSGKN